MVCQPKERSDLVRAEHCPNLLKVLVSITLVLLSCLIVDELIDNVGGELAIIG